MTMDEIPVGARVALRAVEDLGGLSGAEVAVVAASLAGDRRRYRVEDANGDTYWIDASDVAQVLEVPDP